MSNEEKFAAAVEIAEGLKAPKTFDARAAITGATYPTDSIDVYSDAELAHQLNLAANDAAKARYLAETIKAIVRRQRAQDRRADSPRMPPATPTPTPRPRSWKPRWPIWWPSSRSRS